MEHPVLSFFTSYLANLHIQYIFTDDMNIHFVSLDLGLRNSILNRTDAPSPGILNELAKDTIYQVTDYYDCNYTFFEFPEEHELLFIGP